MLREVTAGNVETLLGAGMAESWFLFGNMRECRGIR